MRRPALALAAALVAASLSPAAPPAVAQSMFAQCGNGTPCKQWSGSTATKSDGSWTLTIPSSANFTAVPTIIPMAYSADVTLANQASVQMLAPIASNGGWVLSGTVTLPNTITVGGAPNKAGGAGIVVVVHALGS